MPLDDEQKALRRQGITASEIAILAGFSRKSTPALIYADKRYGVEIEASIPMRLGDKLEQPIAEIYAEDTGTVLLPVTTLRHPKRPLAIATPDRAVFAAKPSRAVVDIKGRLTAPSECEEPPFKLLQVKSRSWRMAREYGTPGTDEVLDEEHCQVTYEMGVSSGSRCFARSRSW
jgi:predicted phage-related endonuclease